MPLVKGSRRPYVRPHAAAMKMGVQTAPGEDSPPSRPGLVLSPTTCKYCPTSMVKYDRKNMAVRAYMPHRKGLGIGWFVVFTLQEDNGR